MKTIDREEFMLLLKNSTVKPRLQRELRFRPEEIGDWEDRDFIAVMNKSKNEGVLIAELERLYVAPFRLQRRAANSRGRVEAIICDICATWQRGSNSATISFPREKGSVSFLCCGDLLCSLHARGKTPQANLSRVHLRETILPARRIERLCKRLETLLQEVVG